MRMPVWLCGDPDDDCMVFVAAPTRGAARFAEHDMWTGDPQDALAQTVRRVLEDGTIARRVWHGREDGTQYYTLPPHRAQATTEADRAHELTTSEAAALGWRLCPRCEETWAGPGSDLCYECADAVADEAEERAGRACGDCPARKQLPAAEGRGGA